MTQLEERAKEILLQNYKATGGQYICPSWPHYPHQWFWDSCLHAIVCAYLGINNLAKNEIKRLFGFQDNRGCIPFCIFGEKFRPISFHDWNDTERFFYKGWLPPVSSIAGVPVLAQAVKAIGDPYFFQKYADRIISFYTYFTTYRDPDKDGLISIITPREGGRDSSPEYDFFRHGRPPKGFKFLDSALDTFFLLFLEFRYKLMGWDEEKIFQSKIFDVQDLVVNCIYLDGLYDLCWMLDNWDHEVRRWPDIEGTIRKTRDAILAKCWDEDDKTFYSLRNGNEKLRDLTIASLFPLLIPDLPEAQKRALIAMLCDKSKFDVPYPVPSVSISHPEFNTKREWPLWRGPTWMNTNWFLIRGLMKHGELKIAQHIAQQSKEMAEKSGFREFYNPCTADGMRTKHFGWSTLVVTFPDLLKEPMT